MAQVTKTPVQVLNEHCAKAGIHPPIFEYTQTQILPTTSFRADCGLTVGQTQYKAIGVGQRKKDAQHDAAKNMFLELKIGMDDYKKFELLAKPAIINDEVEQWAAEGIRASEIRDSPRRCVVEEDDEDSLYPQAGIGNPIADLEEFCHIQRIPAPQYDMNCQQVGPSHCPIMTVSCSVGNFMLKGRSKTKKLAKRIVAVKVILELRKKKAEGSLKEAVMDVPTESVDNDDIVQNLSLEDQDQDQESVPFTRSKTKTYEDFLREIKFNGDYELANKLSDHPGQHFQRLLAFARKVDENNPLVGIPHGLFKEWLIAHEKGIKEFYAELKNELRFEEQWIIFKSGGKFMVSLEITLPEITTKPMFVSISVELDQAKEKVTLDCITYFGTMTVMRKKLF